jgi:hypothetical protein
VNTQPFGPATLSIQVSRVAAPAEAFERLVRLEQVGHERIEVDVIANCFQIAIAAAVDQERFVPAAEQVAEEFVPAV